MEMEVAHANAMKHLSELENPSELLRQMIITNEVMRAHNKIDNTLVYKSYYEAVMDLGTERYTPEFYIPDEVPHGEMKQCYINAAILALSDSKYTYVEGYAATDDLGIAMSHAWVEDDQGVLIDNTWGALDRETGVTYYGIKFSTEYLEMRWENSGDSFGGLLGEDYGYYSHLENGMITNDFGVVIGEKVPNGESE